MTANTMGRRNPSVSLMKLMPRVLTTDCQKYWSFRIVSKFCQPTQGASSMVSTTVYCLNARTKP